MTEVSVARLYMLRAAYLLIAVGLGVEIWPEFLHHGRPWTLMQGVVRCMLAAVSLLAAVGLRYPLQMLPVLFFELLWKSIWLLVVALPLWTTHQIDAPTSETAAACLMGVIFPIVIPWRYVYTSYLAQRGDRWH